MLSGLGLTLPAIARVIGVAERTLRRKKDEGRVLAVLEKGRAVAETKVGEALYKRAFRRRRWRPSCGGRRRAPAAPTGRSSSTQER